MHSHDRTLLSRLGFADPDKKDRMHDLGCQYLALPENRERIARDVLGRPDISFSKQPIFESPIVKGEGKYQTVVGFIDVVLSGFVKTTEVEDPGACSYFHRWLAIEVKITPVGIGEILRQIKLYRQFRAADNLRWMVATSFPLSANDVAILKGAGVYHVRLGDAFQAWAAAQGTEVADASDSLEI